MRHARCCTTVALLLALTLLAAGCGSSSKDSTASDSASASGGGGGEVTTIEGTLTLDGAKSLTVTGHTGASHKLAITPSTEPGAGELHAIEASGEPVRVRYRGGDALVVTRKSDVLKELQKVTGTVTAVDPQARTLTIAGPGGPVDFEVAAADAQAVDLDHLREHQAAKTPVTVYYDTKGSTKLARGYEDA
jgi:hypothetical protein